MNQDQLYLKIKHGLSNIQKDVFPEVDIDEMLGRDDEHLNFALNKYAKYFNFTENKDKYNLSFCFKTTLGDLKEFYNEQEEKVKQMKNQDCLYELEHKVNEHIYEEVVLCQKKVGLIYLANVVVSYLIMFTFLFFIYEITHILEINTLIGGIFLAFGITFVKLIVDEKYLDRVRKKLGWKAYKRAVRRSLSFYFASVIIQSHCNHKSVIDIEDEALIEMKNKVRHSIDLLLVEII